MMRETKCLSKQVNSIYCCLPYPIDKRVTAYLKKTVQGMIGTLLGNMVKQTRMWALDAEDGT